MCLHVDNVSPIIALAFSLEDFHPVSGKSSDKKKSVELSGNHLSEGFIDVTSLLRGCAQDLWLVDSFKSSKMFSAPVPKTIIVRKTL